jgi:hypothetical protein
VLGRGYVEPAVHRQHLHRKRVQLDAAPGGKVRRLERGTWRHVGKGKEIRTQQQTCLNERKMISERGRVND